MSRNSLADRVLERLIQGDSLDGLGVQKVDGRWDLRGLHFPAPRTLPGPRVAGYETVKVSEVVELKNIVVSSLDLREAHWKGLRLVGVTVRDCLFEGARMPALSVWETTFESCSFRSANLQGASMCGSPLRPWRHSRLTSWSNVDFAGADLRGTSHLAESFRACNFAYSRLDGVNFDGARHFGSQFAGQLSDVEFYRRPQVRMVRGAENLMSAVNFSDAELRYCAFWDIDLADALLPDFHPHVVFKPKVSTARQVLALLEPYGHDDLRAMMQQVIKEGPPTPEARAILHIETLGSTSDERHWASALIRRAEALVAKAQR